VKRFLFLSVLALAPGVLRAQGGVEHDIKIGREAAAEIEKSVGLVRLPKAEALVQKVGNRLVRSLESNPFPFTFSIVDQEEPNAFALPGGFVYVSRGLIVLLENEDELAGVLGHEISHVTLRHSANRQKKAVLPTILALPGAIASESVASMTGVHIRGPLMGAARAYLASYSRDQESEADREGIALAARAGYNPESLSEILNRLERFVEAETGHASKYNMFNDHPMTADRMKAIESLLPGISLTPSEPVSPREDFLAVFEGTPFGPNPAHGIFNGNTFLHPGLMIRWATPADWLPFNEESAAGAYTKDQKAMIALRVAGLERQKDTLIERFVNNYYAKTLRKPRSDKDIDIPGRRASEVILPGSKKNEMLYTLWIQHGEFTFVIMGSGKSEQLDVLRSSATSFADLGTSDRTLVSRFLLSTASFGKGETFDTFSKRTGNVMKPDWLELINGLPKGESPAGGEHLKIILRKPYFEN
jgi:predicted Zn-dependent protease